MSAIMSDKYRVVVELYSDSNPDLVERKIIDDKSVEQGKRNILLVKLHFLSQIILCVPSVDSILYCA